MTARARWRARPRAAGPPAPVSGAVIRPHQMQPAPPPREARRRALIVAGMLLMAFAMVAGQLVRLAILGQGIDKTAAAEPVAASFARPDIVDRRGRLLATDVVVQSAYADPLFVQDADEAAERLQRLFPELDARELRKGLADRSKRFLWVKRSLTPAAAEAVHDLGLPGIQFRNELRRLYPAGPLAAHILGRTDIDNRGVSGLERVIDDRGLALLVHSGGRQQAGPVRLALDLGVSHALREELLAAIERYAAAGAAGVVLDVATGEVLAAASLPDFDPNRRGETDGPAHLDRLSAGTYELGSVFKMFTVAMALDSGRATPDQIYPTREPLKVGPFTIKDLHPQPQALSVTDIFLHSSNVGAGLLALETGAEGQRTFLDRLGLIEPMRSDLGPIAAPQLPPRWDAVATVTISYGHGLAVAPLQFAVAAASLINGGAPLAPVFLLKDGPDTPANHPDAAAALRRLVSKDTSARMRELLRLNVTAPAGTGRRAEVPGYRVGGKTGTAELAVKGGYRPSSVIASFFAAFPMDMPRYATFVLLFEPQRTEETHSQITAGINAAPVTSRLIARIAPILGLTPRHVSSQLEIARRNQVPPFDAPRDAKY